MKITERTEKRLEEQNKQIKTTIKDFTKLHREPYELELKDALKKATSNLGDLHTRYEAAKVSFNKQIETLKKSIKDTPMVMKNQKKFLREQLEENTLILQTIKDINNENNN